MAPMTTGDCRAMNTQPVLVEVTRGSMVESVHRGAAAVVSSRGVLEAAWGDIDSPVYLRSALKPVQALPLIDSGAAGRFGLGAAEVALACASHGGEPVHVNAVREWLARIGLDESALECGAHAPGHAASADALVRAGIEPGAVHNNCSGKHAGYLTTAVHLGEPVSGYTNPGHPVQQRVSAAIASLSGTRHADLPRGVDGCGVPVLGLPLRSAALAMARLADPRSLAPPRAQAASRVIAAMRERPEMVAGSGQFATAVMRLAPGVAVKNGAEGVYAAVLPGPGLGIALKIDDGARRAAEVAMAALLCRLGALPAEHPGLRAWLEPPVWNNRGETVGVVRPARGWPA